MNTNTNTNTSLFFFRDRIRVRVSCYSLNFPDRQLKNKKRKRKRKPKSRRPAAPAIQSKPMETNPSSAPAMALQLEKQIVAPQSNCLSPSPSRSLIGCCFV